jgi:O-antigen/teichoic acid export membrane protein
LNVTPTTPEKPREANIASRSSGSAPSPAPSVSHSSLVGSVSYFGGVNLVAFAGGLIRQKVFAVYLGPSGLGAFGLAASFLELFTTLTRLGAPAGVLRELRQSFSEENWSKAARVFMDVRRITLLVAISLGVGVVFLGPVLDKYIFGGVVPRWSVLVLAIAAPLLLAGELCNSAINALGRIRLMAVSNVTTVLLGLPVATWLVATWGLTGAIVQLSTGAFIAFLVAQGFLFRVFRPGEHRPDRVPRLEAGRAVARAFRVGIAQALHHLAMTGNFFVFRSLIVANMGTVANGLYQGTMALSRQYTIALSGGLFVYLYPRLAARSGNLEGFSHELSRGLSFVLTVVVPIAIGLLAVRDWIVRMVFTAEFSPMVGLMAYSMLGDMVAIVGEVLKLALLASGTARTYAMVGLVTEGLYLGAFALGLRVFGLRGAAGSYLVASLLALPICGVVLIRRGQLKLSPRLVLQLVFAIPAVGITTLAPLGVWTSRGLAIAVALVWVAAWRRELLSGCRY